MTGTYIALRASSEAQRIIERYCDSIEVRDTIEKMHITFQYDPDTDIVKSYPANPGRKYTCKISGVEQLGTGKWAAIVLKLECPELVRRHYATRKAYGLNYSYPEYNLHCSIKYRPSRSDIKKIMSNPDLVGTELVFDGEYVEELDAS